MDLTSYGLPAMLDSRTGLLKSAMRVIQSSTNCDRFNTHLARLKRGKHHHASQRG
jgi:hypothetical protein